MGNTIPHGDRLHECGSSCPEFSPKPVIPTGIEEYQDKASDRGDFGMPGIGRASADYGVTWCWEPQPRFQGWLRRSCCKAPDTMSHHYADCEFFTEAEVRVKPRRSNFVHTTDSEIGHIFLPIFPKTNLAKRIVKHHAPEVFAHFMKRNAEYGDDDDFNLGFKGQYVDISRKVQKLKRRWWDGRPARDGEESDETIITELIGHLFMSLDYLDQEGGVKSDGQDEPDPKWAMG